MEIHVRVLDGVFAFNYPKQSLLNFEHPSLIFQLLLELQGFILLVAQFKRPRDHIS